MKRTKTLMVLLAVILISAMFTTGISAKTSIKSKSVAVNANEVTLAVGDIATLSAIMKPANSTDKLTWSSSDKSVATVNSYGVVTAKEEGEATITVKTTSKKTAKCSVTVKRSLTKTEIEELVKSELLSEESIKKLITDNTISEESVKKLIADNTLSAEDVKKLIKSEGSSTWADGVEVPLVSGQKLPFYINDPNSTGIVGNIKTIKVTKRRMTTTVYSNKETIYLPYKYDITLTADVPAITDAQKSMYVIGLTLGASDAAANIAQVRSDYIVTVSGPTSIANTNTSNLTEIVTLYSVYDIDEFFIESAKWETK